MVAKTELENVPGSRSQPGIISGPDPSPRTIEHLYREVDHLRRELTALYDLTKEARTGIREMVETKFEAQKEGVKLLQDFANRSPTTAEVALQVESLDSLVDVRFTSIDTQFALADKAVSAALAAQEKQNIAQQENNVATFTKMENTFTKLTDEIKARTELALKNLTDNLNDIKNTSLLREGRTSISDPSTAAALDKMAYAVNGLGASRDTAKGAQEGISLLGAIVLGLISAAALVVSVMALIK